MRSGALIVLSAFALFVVPGVAFGKISEHWDQSVPPGSRHAAAVSYNLLSSLAIASGVAVLLAAVALLPAFVQFLRSGGWPKIRRPVLRAVSITLVTVLAGVGLIIWAHSLTVHQRNAGFGWYQSLFVVVGALFAASVVGWTVAAVRVTRNLRIGLKKSYALGSAIAVAIFMPVMTAGAAVSVGRLGDQRALVPGRHSGRRFTVAAGRQPRCRADRDDDCLGGRPLWDGSSHSVVAVVKERLTAYMKAALPR